MTSSSNSIISNSPYSASTIATTTKTTTTTTTLMATNNKNNNNNYITTISNFSNLGNQNKFTADTGCRFGMTTTYNSSSTGHHHQMTSSASCNNFDYCYNEMNHQDTLFIDDHSLFLNTCSPYALRSCFIVNSAGLTQRANTITDQVLKRTVSNLSYLSSSSTGGKGVTKSESDITPRTPSSKHHFDRLQSQSLDISTFHSEYVDTVDTVMEEEDDSVSNTTYSIHYNRKVRMCLVGDEACGKSSIISQYIQKSFPTYHDCTIQESYSKIVRKTEMETFELYITDTSGSDQYKELKDSYIRESLVFVFVFDVTNEKSFENMKQLIKEVQMKKLQLSKLESFPIIVVANKIDLMCSRVVSKKQVRQLMRELKLKHNLSSYIEVSAKQRYHVDKVFKKVLMLTDTWNCIYNLQDQQQQGSDFGFVSTPRKIKVETPRMDTSTTGTDSLFYKRNYYDSGSDTESDMTDRSEGEEAESSRGEELPSASPSDKKFFFTRKRSKTTNDSTSSTRKRSLFSRKSSVNSKVPPRVYGNSAPELTTTTTTTPMKKVSIMPDVHSASDLSVMVGGSSNQAVGLKKGISLSSSLFQLAMGNRMKISKD